MFSALLFADAFFWMLRVSPITGSFPQPLSAAQEREALEAMQRAKLEKYRVSRDLTPEQLLAIAANENLSSEAAAKLAESLGKGREAEAERMRQEEINRLNQARIDDMKELLRMSHGYSPSGHPQHYPVEQLSSCQQSERRFCPQCGTQLSEGARFCASCGSQLN